MPTTPAAATIKKVEQSLTATPLSVKEIATSANLSEATVRRVLNGLPAATKDAETGGWLHTAYVAPAKAAKKAPATSAADRLAAASRDEDRAKAVPGYDLRWPKTSFDLYKRSADAPEGSAPWVVRCNAHGTTTTAADTKEGDRLGRKADRAGWCKPCAKATAKAAS
jgi:hypothetical protein